jgi:hypothetical protein
MSSQKRTRISERVFDDEEESLDETSFGAPLYAAPQRLGLVSQPDVVVPAQREILGIRRADRVKRAREEMIYLFRKAAAAAAEDDHNSDLDGGLEHLVRVTEALVTMNREIWDRCSQRVKITRAHRDFRKQMKEGFDRRHTNIEFVPRGLQEGEISLLREAYSLVKVERKQSMFVGIDVAPLQDMEFRAIPVRKEKIFRLPSLSAVLKTMIHAESFDDCFLDYETFLDKASCLHDSVLQHLLVHLKMHLEEVQVCLGEIDRWAMYRDECLSDLETIFNAELPNLHTAGHSGRLEAQKIKSFMSTGSISLTFNLEKETELAKLKKFVEFSEL